VWEKDKLMYKIILFIVSRFQKECEHKGEDCMVIAKQAGQVVWCGKCGALLMECNMEEPDQWLVPDANQR
jgi:hypothetical protein